MIVKDLDGIEYNWKIPEKIAQGNRRTTSKLHAAAKKLLEQKYPNVSIYEEIPIIVENRKQLYLDFYIPTLNTAYEINGEQHYKFTAAFHKNIMAFYKSIQNDNKKTMWCKINNIELIKLKFNEIKDWNNQI